MMMRIEKIITNEQDMLALGAELAKACQGNEWIYLEGELGAGKTTLVRGFLSGLGHQGKVKSPTYTLIEPYVLEKKEILHIDLYRLTDVAELELIGFRDIFNREKILLIEWASRIKDSLPKPDIEIHIFFHEPGRKVVVQGENVYLLETILHN